MKVFEKYEPFRNIHHPGDMLYINHWLQPAGRILVSSEVIEKLYEEFSKEYYDTEWMKPTIDSISCFIDWLAEYDYKGDV